MKQPLQKKLVFLFFFLFTFKLLEAQVPWDVKLVPAETLVDTSEYISRFYSLTPKPNLHHIGNISHTFSDETRTWNYQVWDYNTLQVKKFIIDRRSFPDYHSKKLNHKKKTNGELLHHYNNVSILRFRKSETYGGYGNIGDFICQYDHTVNAWSPLIKVCDASDSLFFRSIQADRENKYFYYTQSERREMSYDEPVDSKHTVCRLNLSTLMIDTLVTVQMPKRKYVLKPGHLLLSPDGKWLVVSEHWDEGYRNGDPEGSPPVTYIVNTETNELKTCRIPSAPYGYFITPDSRYYITGSYETGEIVKIDIETASAVKKTKGYRTCYDFYVAPSGNYFLLDYNREKSSRKVIDIRSTEDLSLITSVFLDDLFPEKKYVSHLHSIFDNRMIISRVNYAEDMKGKAPHILIHQLPDNISASDPSSPLAAKLEKAAIIDRGYQYANSTQMMLLDKKYIEGDAKPVSVASDGNILLSGRRDVADMTWTNYVCKLTAKGKLIWETEMPYSKGSDISEGVHIPTKDGGCILSAFYYPTPKSYGQSRLTRIDSKGKIIYDYKFASKPSPDALWVDYKQLKVLSDGSAQLAGAKWTAEDERVNWTGKMSPSGKLTVDK